MGLDMYLFKRKKKTNEEDQEIMYWRKANQIRGWFENELGGLENCKDTPVSKKNLINLKNDCEEIIETAGFFDEEHNIKDIPNDYEADEQLKEYLDEKMPSQKGFFFGSYDYDVWYFKNIIETYIKLEEILNELHDDDEIYYFEWW